MKHLFPLIVVLLLVSTSFVGVSYKLEKSSPIYSNGNTFYVGGSGEGNYTKIQDAIDNASDGDTVFVYNGTYVENLIVNKSIDLIGEDKNTTIVDGNRSSNVINITADWVDIVGFTVQKSSNYWMGAGISCSSNYSNISDNSILDNYDGIQVCGNYNIISGNNFRGCNGTPVQFSGSDNIITENIIYGSGEGIMHWWGEILAYSGCERTIIANNKIIDYNSTILRGISFRGDARDNVIFGNLISGYTLGIALSVGIDNTISGNTLRGNGWGIFISNCRKITVSGNILQDNNCGIGLYGCRNNNISRNAMINGTSIGIIISEFSILNKIYQNNFMNNKHCAYFALFSPYNKWEGNYWDKPRNSPYHIIGSIGLFIPSGINFDWHPAQEPYDIGV